MICEALTVPWVGFCFHLNSFFLISLQSNEPSFLRNLILRYSYWGFSGFALLHPFHFLIRFNCFLCVLFCELENSTVMSVLESFKSSLVRIERAKGAKAKNTSNVETLTFYGSECTIFFDWWLSSASFRACYPVVRGHALTSSTALTWRYCLWWRNKFSPFREVCVWAHYIRSDIHNLNRINECNTNLYINF